MLQEKNYKSYKAIYTCTFDQRDPGPIDIKFYKDNEYKFTLNKYFLKDDSFRILLLEWFENNDQTFIVLNQDHGLLSVFDAETGIKIHQTVNNEVLLTGYKLFDDGKYIYAWGWTRSWFRIRSKSKSKSMSMSRSKISSEHLESQKIPVRVVYDIRILLKNPKYEPKYIECYDVKEENCINPGINLFGCTECKDFLEKHDQIFSDIRIESMTEEFNKHRSSDTLLKRFLENNLVEFEKDSKCLLEKIMASDRLIFITKVYGNICCNNYDYALFTKLSPRHDNINFIIAEKLFNYFIDGLPFDEINLRFEIYTDLGNLIIQIKNKLIHCDKIKNMHDGVLPEFFKNHINKIDPDSLMEIKCLPME